MNTTYIRLLQQIEEFAKAHGQIKRFASDFPEQLPNFATETEAYPILFVSPTNSIFKQSTSTIELDVYCYDIIQKDRENINTIMSDTHQILNDLDKWFRYGGLVGLNLMDESSILPLNNDLLDYAGGWVMHMVIDVSSYTVCDIPFIESPVIISEVNDIVYSQYLTKNELPNDLPLDFYCSTTIGDGTTVLTNQNYITYKTDTYRKFYFNDSPISVLNSNEILRNGNDIFILANGFDTFTSTNPIPELPVLIIKLKDCKIINNVLTPTEIEYKQYPSFYRIYGSTFHRGYIYLSSRGEINGVVQKIYKINGSNLNDFKELSLTGFNHPLATNDIQAVKNNLYVLISDTSGTSSFVRIPTDFSSFTTMFTLGTSSAKRVVRGSAFVIYNNEVYIPTRPNTAPGAYTLMGVAVYDLITGQLNREVTNVTVSPNVANTALNPNWMGVHNDKVIIASNRNFRMFRFDCKTLAFEDGYAIPTQPTDDNTILLNGDIYINGEIGLSGLGNPQLLKVPYDNFSGFTIELSTFNSGFGSAGSLRNYYDNDNVQLPFTGGTTSGSFLPLSGGTLTGPIIVPTISATTYNNLPIDIRVTGGTYSNGTTIFTNNQGGTFSVSGYSTGYTLTSTGITDVLGYTPYNSTNPNGYISEFTGGTVGGITNFTSGISATTINSGTLSGNNSGDNAVNLNSNLYVDDNTVKLFHFNTNDGTNVTGVISETILETILIPANTFTTGSWFRYYQRMERTNRSNAASYRLYTNTTPSLAGSPQTIGLYSVAANVGHIMIIRNLSLRSGNQLLMVGVGSLLTDENSAAGVFTRTTFNPTVDNYLISTITPTLAANNCQTREIIITGKK